MTTETPQLKCRHSPDGKRPTPLILFFLTLLNQSCNIISASFVFQRSPSVVVHYSLTRRNHNVINPWKGENNGDNAVSGYDVATGTGQKHRPPRRISTGIYGKLPIKEEYDEKDKVRRVDTLVDTSDIVTGDTSRGDTAKIYKNKTDKESKESQSRKEKDRTTVQTSRKSGDDATNEKEPTKIDNVRALDKGNRYHGSSGTAESTHVGNSKKSVQMKFQSRLFEMREKDKNGEKLTQSYCDKVLGMCVSYDEWDSVLEVLDVMKRQGHSQERSTYRACLQSCFEVGNGSSALEILNAMRHALVEPDSVDVQLAVAALCRNNKDKPGMWRKAVSLLRSWADSAKEGKDGVVAVEAYDAVLFCMGEDRRWVDALKLLRLMEQSLEPKNKSFHPKPVLSTYHAVLETCVAASQGEQAVQLLLSMPSKGIKPTIHTFELVISALSKKQQWRRAVQILDVMDDFNVTQTPLVYNTVMSCCAKAGEVRRAMSLLTKMRKRGIHPTTYTFNSLMSACAGTARWKDALSLLDQCNREPGVDPDIITYTNAMRACARGGWTRRALGLFDVVKQKGLKPDVYCYTAVMDACAKGKMWKRALELLDEMRQNGIPPNEVTYSVAIAACGNGGQWQRALELLHQMKEKGIQINTITYNAAITALAKASRQNLKASARSYASEKFRTSEDEKDFNSDSDSYTRPWYSELQVEEDPLWIRALDLLDQMRKNGVERDAFSYSAAISACSSGGRWQEALDLIKIMQRGGPRTRPNRIAYTAAISACGRSGEWDKALQLFTDMKNEGLQPDRVAYNALISALRVADQAEKVHEIWEEMCGKGTVGSNAIATATPDARSVSPDIITVTDVIATLDRSQGKPHIDKIDSVFSEAVERGIIFRSDSLDSVWEVDLSGMSFPVARAACRYVFRRVLKTVRNGDPVKDISLITGVGKSQRHNATRKRHDSFKTLEEQVEEPKQEANKGATALREYVRQILRHDFDPPLYSTVPRFAQGTVQVKSDLVQRWIEGQS